jgi:Flp pilus assembly protein CpaB
VLYATQPVEPGVKISSAFFEKKLTPTDILPDAYTDQSDIVGFYAIRKIEKGDPLTPRNIGKSLPYMSQRITPGMRAVSLQVYNADYNRTGGFVVDGDRVDLLCTFAEPTGQQFEINTQTFMQNVQVLYVPGSQIKTDKTDGINPLPPPGDQIAVTFEVTPEQAQALIFLSRGKNLHISMILRSRADHSELKLKPFDVRDYDLLNLKKVQKTVDKSIDRVNELSKEIQAEEQKQSPQGTTNETPTPTPPSP